MPKTKTKKEIPIEKSFRINNRLRHFRRQKGYRQKEVAQILGVDPAQISRWERGKESLTLSKAFDLSFVYRRLVEDVFEELFDERREIIWQREEDFGFHKNKTDSSFLYT